MSDRLPILILAGGNDQPGTIPSGFNADDVLRGFKGAMTHPSGRCIAAELAQRVRDSERFQEPIVVGPRRVYQDLVDCEIVDTAGNLLSTINAFSQLLNARFPERPVAVSACDILPTAADFRELMDTSYAPYANSGLWWQLIDATPEEMGVSGWKPSYPMRMAPGEPLLNLYPGHLLVLRSDTIRLESFNRFLMLAYRFRNRSVYERMIRITLRALWLWLADDLRRIASFRWPGRLVACPYGIFRSYLRYRRDQFTVSGLAEELTRQIMVPDRIRGLDYPVALAVTRIRSFAKDIDTRPELEEILGDAVMGQDGEAPSGGGGIETGR